MKIAAPLHSGWLGADDVRISTSLAVAENSSIASRQPYPGSFAACLDLLADSTFWWLSHAKLIASVLDRRNPRPVFQSEWCCWWPSPSPPHAPSTTGAIGIPLPLLSNGGLVGHIHIGGVAVGFHVSFGRQLLIDCLLDLLIDNLVGVLSARDRDPFVGVIFAEVGAGCKVTIHALRSS